VSNDIEEHLINHYHADRKYITHTVNGIDTEKFCVGANRVRPFNNEKKRIIHVSRMDKGPSDVAHMLIDAAPVICAEFDGAEIILIGGGDDFENIEKRAAQMNERLGRPAITTTGARTDVETLVAEGDVFVGVSRAALEAMSAEVPVVLAGFQGYIGIFGEDTLDAAVATNFTGRGLGMPTPELVAGDVVNVLSYRGQTPGDGRPGAVVPTGEFGRKIVLENYSIDRMRDDALAVYAKVLRESCEHSRPIDILISGYYGYRNSGDDSILKAMLVSLKQLNPGLNIAVLSKNPADTAKTYGVTALQRFNMWKLHSTLRDTKLLISGGGSLIQDVTSTQSLIYYLTVVNMALKRGAKVMLYANGIGPVNGSLNRRMAAKSLNNVDYITLREELSLEELTRLGVVGVPVEVTSDPAFSLEPAAKEDVGGVLRELGIGEGVRYFGISVRSWSELPDGFERELAGLADYVYERYGVKSVVIPMQQSLDDAISQRVLDSMAHRGVLYIPGSTEELLRVVAESEFIIGMRLHMLIYAAVSGIPVVGLVYDPKIEAMMTHMGQKYALPLNEVTKDALQKCVDEIIENKDTISNELKEKALSAREKTLQTARIAVDLAGN